MNSRKISNVSDFQEWLRDINYMFLSEKDFDIIYSNELKLSTEFGKNVNMKLVNDIAAFTIWNEFV